MLKRMIFSKLAWPFLDGDDLHHVTVKACLLVPSFQAFKAHICPCNLRVLKPSLCPVPSSHGSSSKPCPTFLDPPQHCPPPWLAHMWRKSAMHLLPDRFAKQLWCYEPCYMNPEQLPWEEGGIPVRTSQCWPSPAFPYLPPPSSPVLVILGLFIFLATFMSIKEQIAPVPNRVSRFTALLFWDAQLRQHHC